jgi:hypothetical protein
MSSSEYHREQAKILAGLALSDPTRADRYKLAAMEHLERVARDHWLKLLRAAAAEGSVLPIFRRRTDYRGPSRCTAFPKALRLSDPGMAATFTALPATDR